MNWLDNLYIFLRTARYGLRKGRRLWACRERWAWNSYRAIRQLELGEHIVMAQISAQVFEDGEEAEYDVSWYCKGKPQLFADEADDTPSDVLRVRQYTDEHGECVDVYSGDRVVCSVRKDELYVYDGVKPIEI